MPATAEQIRGLFPEVSDIKDRALQDTVITIWQEACAAGGVEDLTAIPKNLKNIGYTLVNHTRVVTELCKAAAERIKSLHRIDANIDYLLAAALLHDVSKVLEMKSENGKFHQTEYGKKIQHGFYAAYKAYEKGLPMEIQHMLVSHTPQSGVLPQSIEAVILYNIDTTDTEVLNHSRGIAHKPKG